MAAITVWLDELNNEYEETFNEEEDNGEDLAEEDAICKIVLTSINPNNLKKVLLTQWLQ